MHRVLSTGMTVAEIVDLVGKTRVDEPDPAAIWFCYPDVELQSFRQWCEDKLLDGLLLVDADHRSDADDIASCLEDMEIPRIAFVTAEIDQDEIERARAATGYIMLQAFPGKTGARNGTLDPAVAFRIERLRDAAVGVPIVLGVGLSEPEQVRQALAMGADGVVIGSACVQAALGGEKAITTFLRSMRSAATRAA